MNLNPNVTLRQLIALQLVVGVALALLLLPALTTCCVRADNAKCKNNLKQLGTAAVGLYVSSHGRLPPTDGVGWLNTLYETNTLADPDIYRCSAHADPPSGRTDLEPLEGAARITPARTSYIARVCPYPPARVPPAEAPMVADESLDFHEDNINALYMDGHVEGVPLINGEIDPLTRPPFRGTLGDR